MVNRSALSALQLDVSLVYAASPYSCLPDAQAATHALLDGRERLDSLAVSRNHILPILQTGFEDGECPLSELRGDRRRRSSKNGFSSSRLAGTERKTQDASRIAARSIFWTRLLWVAKELSLRFSWLSCLKKGLVAFRMLSLI
jgi:hypothetical protein